MRTITADLDLLDLAHAAERECIDAGAAPSTVTVETKVDNRGERRPGGRDRARWRSRPARPSTTTRAPRSATSLPRPRWRSDATTCTWWSRTSTTGSTPATARAAWPSSTASARSPSPRRAAIVTGAAPAFLDELDARGVGGFEAARDRNVAPARLDPRGLAHARSLRRAHARGDRRRSGASPRGGARAGRRRHRALMSLYREASGREQDGYRRGVLGARGAAGDRVLRRAGDRAGADARGADRGPARAGATGGGRARAGRDPLRRVERDDARGGGSAARPRRRLVRGHRGRARADRPGRGDRCAHRDRAALVARLVRRARSPGRAVRLPRPKPRSARPSATRARRPSPATLPRRLSSRRRRRRVRRG